MLEAMRHVGIVVDDMEKRLAFYRDFMGLAVRIDFREKGEYIDTVQGLEGVDVRMVKLGLPDGSLIELLKDDGHPPGGLRRRLLCDPGIGHVAFTVGDREYIDFTSSIMLANAGHSHPRIARAIRRQLDAHLFHNYCYPSEIRMRAVEKLLEIVPGYLNKVFLLTTGGEAVECAIKLMRLHGRRIRKSKYVIVSFEQAFHGRTMGAQVAGGYPEQKEWMGALPGGFHQIPYPAIIGPGAEKTHTRGAGEKSWRRALGSLRKRVRLSEIAGFLMESYHGPSCAFMDKEFVRAMRKWASAHDVLMTFDEVQAAFGRTGKWFGFEHYRVQPDLIICGKGITSSLPMSAVIGRGKIMDLAAPGTMSSTHTGNPICCAAAVANIEVLQRERLVERAATLGRILRRELRALARRHPDRIAAIHGRGCAFGVVFIDPRTGRANIPFAEHVVDRCMEKGLLMLQTGRGTLKIAPPLSIPEGALRRGLEIIADAVADEADDLCAGRTSSGGGT